MKTALITGVNRGIGKALAEYFLAKGWAVIGTSRDGTSSYAHPHLSIFQLELSNAHSREGCAEKIKRAEVKIDILINNAAVLIQRAGPDIDAQTLRDTLEVNVIGAADFTERVVPYLQTGGHIVNVSSKGGSIELVRNIDYPEYRISKAALNMVTKLFAVRLDGLITVSAVHPGRVRTDMALGKVERSVEEAAKFIYELAISNVESGHLWFDGEKIPW